MTFYEITTVLHVIGAAVGVGAAATSDSIFLASIRNRRISKDQLLLIRRSSNVVLGGLTLLVLSGIALFFYNVAFWESPHFQAKMTAVIVLMINGIVFHAKVIPLLKKCDHEKISEAIISSNQWLLAITGNVSAVSWFSAIIIAVIGPVGLDYIIYLAIFLGLIVIGSVVAYFIISHLIFKEKEYTAEEASNKPNEKKITVISITVLMILLISSLAFGIFGPQKVFVGEEENEMEEEADLELGANIYENECSACHGPDGGLQAGDYSLQESTMDKEEIETVIREGVGTMPGFEDELTEEEIEAVTAYAKQLQSENE